MVCEINFCQASRTHRNPQHVEVSGRPAEKIDSQAHPNHEKASEGSAGLIKDMHD